MRAFLNSCSSDIYNLDKNKLKNKLFNLLEILLIQRSVIGL
jgi:hypothetical protein